MKKIALALIFGLLLQVPATVMASDGPPPTLPAKTSPAVILGAAVVTGILVFFGGGAADGASAKKTGNEFADLNNNTSFKGLLNQVAGGSMNTLEILK